VRNAARALGGYQHHLENVADVFEAILDRNSGHVLCPSAKGREAPVSRQQAEECKRQGRLSAKTYN
jgi:hypothetical protein